MIDTEKKIFELEKANKELLILNSELEANIIGLTDKLAYEMRNNIGEKILLEYYQGLFNGAAANYLLDPNPEKLETQGSKTGTSTTHLIQIKNIIAVKSDGRMKKIYLVEAQKPIQGGLAENPLIMNSDESNWQNTLFSIQRNQQFLFRINRSSAINIFHYTLCEDKKFKLNEALKATTDPIIHLIPIDSTFEPLSYQKRLLEVKQLFDCQIGLALNFEKLDEISRYIKSCVVTKDSV